MARAKESTVSNQPVNQPIHAAGQIPDFSSPDTYLKGHPYGEYERLRRQAPIFWNPEPAPAAGFWVLTRYEDIVFVSNNPELFCNGYGYKSVDDTYGRISSHVGAAMSRILPAIDPPEHTALKKVLAPFFSPRAVADLEDGVRAKARRIIARLEGRDVIDAVMDLAVHLPIEVLADLLGVAEIDRPRLLYWTDGIFGADDTDYFANPQDAAGRLVEMFEYGSAAIEDRRKHPRDAD
jgi:cytochrome P450